MEETKPGYSVGKHLGLLRRGWVFTLICGFPSSLLGFFSVFGLISTAHPAFAHGRCGGWRKMSEASPWPRLPPQRLRPLCPCTLVARVRPSSGKLALHCPLFLHPRERPHSPQLHPCSGCPCSGLSSGRSLWVWPLCWVLPSSTRCAAPNLRQLRKKGCDLWLLSSLTWRVPFILGLFIVFSIWDWVYMGKNIPWV